MEYNGEKLYAYGSQRVAVECTIISKFVNEDTGKHYLVYTDETRDPSGRKNKFVVSYNPDDADDTKLVPVETQEEWESISGFLEDLMAMIQEKGLDL